MVGLCDWLDFSIQGITFNNFCKKFPQFQQEYKIISPRYGYRIGMTFNGITVYHNDFGSVNLNSDNHYDIYISISGTGCRTFESLVKGKNPWLDFLSGACRFYENILFRRVDIALDLHDHECPTVAHLTRNYIIPRRYVSDFRTVKYMGGAEETIYFGSPQSELRLRIYNKAMERGFKDRFWVRFEYQLRRKRAAAFVKEYISRGDLGQCMKGCLRKSITFTSKRNKGDRNSDKLTPARWWSDLVAGAEKINLFEPAGVEYNFHQLDLYINKQILPSLYTYKKVTGDDLEQLAERAKDRINPRQRFLIETYQKKDGG